MDLEDFLLKQYKERIEVLSDTVTKGNCASYEEYKYLCGQIRGLEAACFVIKDLQPTTETEDD